MAARDETEAVACYRRDLNEDADDEYTIVEVEQEKWPTLRVRDEDDSITNIAAIVGDPQDERDAFVVSTTCC